MKRADLKTVKMACVLYNKIATIRAKYPDFGLAFKIKDDVEYVIYGDRNGDPILEAFGMAAIIRFMLKYGKICVDRVDDSDKHELIIWLKKCEEVKK